MEAEDCYHMPWFIAHVDIIWNLGILAYILKRGTEFATQLEVCLIVIQPLVNGAPHISRAAIESWAHALTSNCCIFCGIGQWLWRIRCALTLFRCDSETSNDHGTKFYFILFDTRQAHSMPWCFTSSKAWQSDLPVFLCSILSLWISCREGTVKCWDNGHVWLSMSFKYPRITLQVVCVQPEGHSIVHQMQVMSVNCWISVDTYLSTFNHIFSSPLTLKFRANGSWNVDCKFFVKYNNSVLGEVGIKWTSKTTTTSEINHKPKKLGPTKKAKRRPTTHQKCLWSCKSPQHNPYS